jgi:tetrahydromethanopterin S-methyltransferase subunit H
LKFKKEQKIFDIGGVEIGGQPGELPTVLIGSVFYSKHKVVKDSKQGIFDKKKTNIIFEKTEYLSEKTGNPFIVDIEAFSKRAVEKYIDFVSEITNVPFMINSGDISVRLHGIMYAAEKGLTERAIYTSINFKVSEEEIITLKDAGVKSALIQAFNPKNPLPKGMLKIIKENNGREGLMETVLRAGIEKPLLLTPVLDVPSISYGVKGVYMLKEEFGLPTGIPPVGVVSIWSLGNIANDLGIFAKKICEASVTGFCPYFGSDFIHFGALRKAETIFPAVAINDAILAYGSRLDGIKQKTRNHPLYKIL